MVTMQPEWYGLKFGAAEGGLQGTELQKDPNWPYSVLWCWASLPKQRVVSQPSQVCLVYMSVSSLLNPEWEMPWPEETAM